MKQMMAVLILLALTACGGAAAEAPRSCADRGLATRSDGACYVAATPAPLAPPALARDEFVDDCAYQTRRLREVRRFYTESEERSHTGSASKTATARLMAAALDQQRACR